MTSGLWFHCIQYCDLCYHHEALCGAKHIKKISHNNQVFSQDAEVILSTFYVTDSLVCDFISDLSRGDISYTACLLGLITPCFHVHVTTPNDDCTETKLKIICGDVMSSSYLKFSHQKDTPLGLCKTQNDEKAVNNVGYH